MRGPKQYAVAASSRWTDPDTGVRMPSGEVHAWEQGRNETLCGLSLSRSELGRFPHVSWPDTFPESGGAADRVQRVCPRCAAAAGPGHRGTAPRWERKNPRP